MYEIMKKIIIHKTEPKEAIQNKLDIFLAKNRITIEEYEELVSMLG